MIFGWLENGVTDRWVLIDPVLPWPALANGRDAIRVWASYHNRKRALDHTPGPRRCPWPCKTTVKDHGAAELRVWACEPYGKPRLWDAGDKVWRPEMASLAELMATDIQCPVTLMWMASGGKIERAVKPPGLRDRTGFDCWGKGQREPGETLKPRIVMKITTANLNLLQDTHAGWHGTGSA